MKIHDRRNFLKAGAAIGGTFLAAPLTGFAATPTRKKKEIRTHQLKPAH